MQYTALPAMNTEPRRATHLDGARALWSSLCTHFPRLHLSRRQIVQNGVSQGFLQEFHLCKNLGSFEVVLKPMSSGPMCIQGPQHTCGYPLWFLPAGRTAPLSDTCAGIRQRHGGNVTPACIPSEPPRSEATAARAESSEGRLHVPKYRA